MNLKPQWGEDNNSSLNSQQGEASSVRLRLQFVRVNSPGPQLGEGSSSVLLRLKLGGGHSRVPSVAL